MADKASGPQYRLMTEHYIADQLLEPGTIIGDGTPFPFVDPDGKPVPPSRQMEPLNEAAEAEIAKLPGNFGNPVDQLPIAGAR